MLTAAGGFLTALVVPPSLAYLFVRFAMPQFVLRWALVAAIAGVIAGLAGDQRDAAGNAASVLLAIAWWLWSRRRRLRRALRSLGAKSRARLAAVVRRAREALRPRPVLRPLPGRA